MQSDTRVSDRPREAWVRVNRQRWSWRVVACVAACLGGCDSVSPVAPTATVLSVAANPATITLDQTSELTVTGSGPFGNPLTPGTQLVLSTTLGRLSQENVAADVSGTATATLTPEGQTGTATVTVVFEGGRSPESTTVDIEIITVRGTTTPPAFQDDFSPASITADEVSTPTFTIDNAATTASSTALTIAGNLPSAGSSGQATTQLLVLPVQAPPPS